MGKNITSIFLYAILIGASYFEGYGMAGPTQDTCKIVIKGQILDAETHAPVPYATVRIKNMEEGAAADQNGIFILENLCSPEFTLIITSVGYKQVSHHHDSHHGDPVIYMAPTLSELKSIVIEGKAIVGDMQSMALERISKNKLTAKNTKSLASMVSELQGVNSTSAGINVQIPVIHGLYGNRILIVNNGVQHGFQNWGMDHAPEISISNANNITVLKGGAGVKYGPEALGGVIVVEGDPLRLAEKFNGAASLGYQTNGKGLNATTSFGRGYESLSYYLGANYSRTGDRHAPEYFLTNTGMEEKALDAGFRYHLPNWDYKLYYSIVNQNLGLLRGAVAESGNLFARAVNSDKPLIIKDFSFAINAPRQNTSHHLATAKVDWYPGIGNFSLLLSKQLNSRKEFDVRRNANLPIINLDLITNNARVEWNHPVWNAMEGLIGLQYFSQDNDNVPGTGTTPFIPNYNTHRLSAFLIESMKKGETTYELGLRIDHERNSVRGRESNQEIFKNEFAFRNITTSLGMVHDFSDNLKLRTNFGTAWRWPNMAELYSFGQHGIKSQFGLWRYYTDEQNHLRTDSVLTKFSGKAAPENGFKWINELTYKHGSHTLNITAYSHFIENYTFDRPVDIIGTIRGPMPVFIYDQSNAFLTGFDITYTHELTGNLEWKTGGSYLWSQIIDNHEQLLHQPPANINLELSWKRNSLLGLKSTKLILKPSYTFRQFQAPRTIPPQDLISGKINLNPNSEIFDFKNPPEGYFLTDAQWVLEGEKWGGTIALNNIFNISYRDYMNQLRYFADETGRNLLLTINYKF